MVFSLRWIGIVLLFAAGAADAADKASPSQAADTPNAAITQPAGMDRSIAPEALAPQILPAPTNDAEIADRIALTKTEQAKLGPASQPSTAPATGPADLLAAVRWRLAETLGQYRAELENWQKVRADIARLKSTEAGEKLDIDRKHWQQLRQECLDRQEQEARYAWKAKAVLDEVGKALADRSDELKRYQDLQSARDQQMTALLGDKTATEATAKTTLAGIKRFLAELPGELARTDRSEDRARLLMQKRALEWQHNLQLLRAATFADRTTQLEIARQQDADRIDALRKYVTTLQAYRSRLEKIVSKDEVDLAKQQLARPDLPPYLRTYWEIHLVVLQGVDEFQTYQKFIDDIRTGHPELAVDDLKQQLERARGYLHEFMESVDRRSGDKIREVYRMLEVFIVKNEDRLEQVQANFDQINDRLRRAQEQQSDITIRVALAKRSLNDLIETLPDVDRTRARELQARMTGEVNAFTNDRIDSVLKDLTALRDQYAEAVPLLVAHIGRLERARSELYWRRLMISDRSLFEQDWTAIRLEWQALRSGVGESAVSARAVIGRTREDLRSIALRQYVITLFMVALGVYGGWRSRRYLRDWGHAKERAIHETAQALGHTEETWSVSPVHRLEVQVARALARSATTLCPLVLLLVCLLTMRVGGQSLPIMTGAAGALLLLVAGSAAINAAFDPRRSHWRIIQCSNPVAHYHRWWLRLLGVAAIVLLPVPLTALAIGVLPLLAKVVWDIALSIFLMLVFAYFARRRMFVHLASASERVTGLWATIWPKVFPLLPVMVLALVGLQLSGYAVLVAYLIRGLALTALVLLAAKIIRSLLAAWSGLMQAIVFHRRGSAPEEAQDSLENPVWSMVAQVGRLAVTLAAAVAIPAVWGVSLVELRELAGYPLVTVKEGAITPARIVGAILAVVAGFAVSRTLRAFLHTAVFPQTRQVDRGTQAAISTLLHYSMIALAAYVGLKVLYLDLGALAIFLGTLGLGLGLGLQPLFVNFISGLVLLLERQIKVGDVVEIDGTPCEVLTVSMRSTLVRTPDNVEYVIPNGDFITNRVVNWTLTDQRLRARMQIGVAYGSDPQLVRKLLLDIAHRHPDVLVDPPPEVWFTDFADNALIFVLVCWFANADARWRFLSQVRFEMTEVFKAHGIEIPFPQRTFSFLGDKPLPVEIRKPPEAEASR